MLTSRDRKNKRLVYPDSTSYLSDYQYGQIKKYKPTPKPLEKREPKLGPRRNLNFEYMQVMGDVPFDMKWETEKKIPRTRPSDVPQPRSLEKEEDPGRKRAQATRPRVVMTPAVAVDDIVDDKVRDMLMGVMYSTTTQTAMKEAVVLARYKAFKAPLPGYSRTNPISLPKLAPVVPAEWRRDSVTWESKQLRSIVDLNREFWQHWDIKCSACKVSDQVKRLKKISSRF